MSVLIKNKKFNLLFLLIVVCAFALPYARILIGSIPIYILSVCSLLLSFIAFTLIDRKINIVVRSCFIFIIVFIILTFFHLLAIENNLLLFTNFNRLVSFFFLIAVFYLNYTHKIDKQFLLKMINIGFKFHICLILIHYISSIIGGSVLELFYDIIYKVISQSDKFYDRISKFQDGWSLQRYYGGYHNPNPAGVSLVFGYILLIISGSKTKRIWIFLFFLTLILTSSKQSIILLFIFLLFENIKKAPTYFTVFSIFGFVLTFTSLNNLLERVFNSGAILNSGVERSWGYVNFIEFINLYPLRFIFGTGINSISFRTNYSQITSLDVGFVSNSFLLIFSFIGVIGFVFLTMVFYSFYKLTRNKRKLLFLLFLILFVSLFDNHIAIMESMQTIIFLGIVLISDIKKKEWNTYI